MGESTNIKTKKRFKPDFKNLIILIFDYIFVLLGYIISLMTLCEVDAKFVNAAYLTTLVLVTPFYTLGMNYACEITYPVGESINGGIMMTMSQLSGIGGTFLCDHFIQHNDGAFK